MTKVLDCNLKVSKFELQSRYRIYFGNKTRAKGIVAAMD